MSALRERGYEAGLVISTERHPDALVLAFYGDLDLASAPFLEEEICRAEQKRPDQLVLDLSGLNFMDLTGLEVLLRAAERRWFRGEWLSLLRAPRGVQRLFDLTGTTGLFWFDD
jgi:anti-sigma B factor antagonist